MIKRFFGTALTTLFLVFSITSYAASTVYFVEDFETVDAFPSGNGWTISSIDGHSTGDWDTNATFSVDGGRSAYIKVQPNLLTNSYKRGEYYLISPKFNPAPGDIFVELSFYHAAITRYQKCRVEYTYAGASGWTRLTGGSEYLTTPPAEEFPSRAYFGVGRFANENDYPDAPAQGGWNSGGLMYNNIWKKESFDFSPILNHTDVQIRFYFDYDNATTPDVAFSGWFLDSIMVTGFDCEGYDPSYLEVNGTPTGDYYSVGPYPFEVSMIDQSGIDSVFMYYKNGVGGSYVSLPLDRDSFITDTSWWSAFIPETLTLGATLLDTIYYYISGRDSCSNSSRYPVSGDMSFVIFKNQPAGCSAIINDFSYYDGDLQNYKMYPPTLDGDTAYINGTTEEYPEWYNVSNDSTDWHIGWPDLIVDFPENTGPPSARDHTTQEDPNNISGVYLYYWPQDSNTLAFNDTAKLESACFDLDPALIPTPYLEYFTCMYGDTNIKQLEVEIYDGSTWSSLGSLSGNQGSGWNWNIHDLSPYLGDIVKFRFTAISNTDTVDGTKGNIIAIDDIFIRDLKNKDMKAIGLKDPYLDQKYDLCYEMSSSEQVGITVFNYGTTPLDTIPVGYRVYRDGIDITPGGLVIDTLFYADSLSLGDTVEFNFEERFDMSVSGLYKFVFWTDLADEEDRSNDTAVVQMWYFAPISEFPWREDFENWPFLFNKDTVGYGWSNDPNAGYGDWRASTEAIFAAVWNGASYNENTGPSGDNTVGLGGTGNYLLSTTAGYIGLFCWSFLDSCSFRDILRTPCFDFRDVTKPAIKFDYYYSGPHEDAAELTLQVYSNSAWEDVSGFSARANGGDQWFTGYADLTDYAGQVIRLRFVNNVRDQGQGLAAIVGSTEPPVDMAFDNFEIVDVKNYDIELAEILSPTTGCGLSYEEKVKIRIRNTGSKPLSNTYIYYQLESLPPVATVVSKTLAPSEEYTVTLNGTLNMSHRDSMYDLLVWVDNHLDEQASNDTLDVDIYNGDGCALDLFLVAGYNNQFFGAGSAYWELKETFSGDNLGIAYLASYQSGGVYNVRLCVPDYEDVTFTKIDIVGGGLNYWELSAYGTTYADGGQGLSEIASFKVNCPYLMDGETKELLTTEPELPVPRDYDVTVDVCNIGILPIKTAIVELAVDGSVVVTDTIETISDPLENGECIEHTFSAPWVAVSGNRDVDAYMFGVNYHDVLSVTDTTQSNDTTKINVHIFDTPTSLPYCTDLDGSEETWDALNLQNYKPDTIWEWGAVEKTTIASTDGWSTGLVENYPYISKPTALFTPVFPINQSSCYTVEFTHSYSTEENEDGGIVEYTLDEGASWSVLGREGYESGEYDYQRTNWYNTPAIVALGTTFGSAYSPGWSGNSNGSVVSNHDMDFSVSGGIVFRFRFASGAFGFDEGWTIEDFCFYEDTSARCLQILPLAIDENQVVGQDFRVEQNIPNPFNGQTLINYFVPANGEVGLKIKNVLGQELLSAFRTASMGKNSITLDLDLADGVYYYELTYGGESITKKMIAK